MTGSITENKPRSSARRSSVVPTYNEALKDVTFDLNEKEQSPYPIDDLSLLKSSFNQPSTLFSPLSLIPPAYQSVPHPSDLKYSNFNSPLPLNSSSTIADSILPSNGQSTNSSVKNAFTSFVTLKKGWLYKRSNVSFGGIKLPSSFMNGKWHPKWAILVQELPNGLTLPSNLLDINPSYSPSSSSSSSKKDELSITSGPAKLYLYDERSHSDTKQLPKYSFEINSSISSELISKEKKFIWYLTIDDKKIEFSTCSVSEGKEWFELLERVKRPQWYKEYEKSDISSSSNTQAKPSAPQLEEETIALKLPSLIIPSPDAQLQKENLMQLAYNQTSILSPTDIDLILQCNPYSISINPSQDTISKWKNEKWNEWYQSSLSKVCFGAADSICQLKFMDKLSEFKTAAIYYAKKLVDEYHVKPLHTDQRMRKITSGELTVKFAAEYKLGIDMEKNEKKLEHEVKAIRSILSIRQPDLIKTKLLWIIDYKGFKLEASVNLPTSDNDLVMDLDRSDPVMLNDEVLQRLDTLGKYLNLKCYSWMDSFYRNVNIGLSRFIKVYLSKSRANEFYAKDLSHLLPIDVSQSSSENDMGMIKVNPHYRLRMEYLSMLNAPVAADIYKDDSLWDSYKEDEFHILEVSKALREAHLNQLVGKLDSLDIIPWSSCLLTEFLHIHGMNIRYLGLMAERTSLPHVKEYLLIEIVARSFKYIFRQQSRQAIFHFQEMGATNIHKELCSFAVDMYLKLLGKNNPENQKFLNETLNIVIKNKFGISDIPYETLHKQALFEAMNYQCSVVWEDKIYDFSHTIESPLVATNVIGFGFREKGVIKPPEIYPYQRLNEHRRTAALGLLVSHPTDEDWTIFGSDYMYTARGYSTGNNLDQSQPSPIQNYFTSVLPTSLMHPILNEPQQSHETLNEYNPPPIPLMASLHFSGLGPLFKCSPDRTSALWFYLLAHHSLFTQSKPRIALWQATVGLALNRKISEASESPLGSEAGNGLTQSSSNGGVLNAQLRLVIAQCLLILKNESPESSGPIEDHQSMIDLAHRELVVSVGSNHPLVMRFYQILASSFYHIKQLNVCVEYQKTAVELSLRGLGKTHSWTLRALLLLGSFCLHNGDIEQALHAFKEALQGATQISNKSCILLSKNGEGSSASDLSAPFYNDPIFESEIQYALSETYQLYGDLEKALEHGQASQQLKEAHLGSDHPLTINAYYQVAEMALTGFLSLDSNPGLLVPGNEGPSSTSMSIQGQSQPIGFSWLHMVTAKVMTKSMMKYAHLALSCYEKIFQFVKFQASTNSMQQINQRSGPLNGLNKTQSPLKIALYTPIRKSSTFSCKAANGISENVGENSACPPIQEQELISNQLFELSKKCILLKICLASPGQRETLRRLLKRTSLGRIFGEGNSIIRSTTQDNCSINETSFVNDVGGIPLSSQGTIYSMPQSSSSAGAVNMSPTLLKQVVLKLIAYNPVVYFDSLMDKYCHGPSISNESITLEQELLAVVTLLGMTSLSAAIQ